MISSIATKACLLAIFALALLALSPAPLAAQSAEDSHRAEAQSEGEGEDESFEAQFAEFALPPAPHEHPADAVDITQLDPRPAPGTVLRDLGMGHASYYGRRFAGRPTANGEIFDPAAMTAAHKTLPFGSMVRVTNPLNGRSVLVRINDRGPFIEGRDIDLSRAAAEEIGLVQRGVGEVQMELIAS